MNYIKSILCLLLLSLTCFAEVRYTSANYVVPENGTFQIDFNYDEISDVIITSQAGNNWWMIRALTPAIGMDTVDPLEEGDVIGNSGFFFGTYLVDYSDGTTNGDWNGLVNRYIGVSFRDMEHVIHYGWVKLATVGYIDNGELHLTTIITGWAYETTSEPIKAGDTGD